MEEISQSYVIRSPRRNLISFPHDHNFSTWSFSLRFRKTTCWWASFTMIPAFPIVRRFTSIQEQPTSREKKHPWCLGAVHTIAKIFLCTSKGHTPELLLHNWLCKVTPQPLFTTCFKSLSHRLRNHIPMFVEIRKVPKTIPWILKKIPNARAIDAQPPCIKSQMLTWSLFKVRFKQLLSGGMLHKYCRWKQIPMFVSFKVAHHVEKTRGWILKNAHKLEGARDSRW